MIRRREFITALGSAAAAPLLWPVSLSAQQTARLPRIGVLLGVSPSDTEWLRRVTSFTQALQLLGWTESRKREGGDTKGVHVLAQRRLRVGPEPRSL